MDIAQLWCRAKKMSRKWHFPHFSSPRCITWLDLHDSRSPSRWARITDAPLTNNYVSRFTMTYASGLCKKTAISDAGIHSDELPNSSPRAARRLGDCYTLCNSTRDRASESAESSVFSRVPYTYGLILIILRCDHAYCSFQSEIIILIQTTV